MANTLFFLAVLYLAVVAAMYVMQRSLQYHPTHSGSTPESLGLEGVRLISLRTQDGETLEGWRFAAAEGRPTVLYFHGNGGEASSRMRRMAFYRAQGVGFLFISYRGFGASSGSPTEEGLIIDAQTARAALASEGIAPERIVCLGESLGSGVAVQLAAKEPPAALILETPYTSAADVGALKYPLIPVHLLMKDQFDSRAYLPGIKVPALVVHGDADTLIPYAQGQEVFSLLGGRKEFITLPGGEHDAVHEEPVWQAELDFMLKHLP